MFLPLTGLAGGGGTDTRNFDNFQQGRVNVQVLNNSLAVESSFIPFPIAYSSLPNMTLQTTNASQGGVGIGVEIVSLPLLNNSFRLPMVVTAGFAAPTWVVPNAVTEIFGNTQNRQSADADTASATISDFYFSDNIISVLPVGDNGKLWFQYSLNNGGTWNDLPGGVSCTGSGLSLRISGVSTSLISFQQGASVSLSSKTLFRVVGCSGNGVGSVTIGGVWITITELISKSPFSETAVPILEVVNETLAGFNIVMYFQGIIVTEVSGVSVAELTVNIQWTAWLISKTCTTGCS